ncbi:MAG: RNA 2',3'-cyclic phosphodiesterase [Desulfobacterales bacterium]|nr:RNA 2',3'-cyclic phosphodiesterase [Desulfobacterales bacterium]
MEIRSFLAFKLPGDIKDMVSRISREVRRYSLDVRWVNVDNIHLTMVFMGNVRTERLEGIEKAAKKACRRYGPFEIHLKDVGFFGGKRNPRVLWIGMGGDLKRLSKFRGALHRHLKPFGVKEEKRPFRPHLTIGRFRKGARSNVDLDEITAKYQGLDSPVCPLEELVLFKSELKPGGAVYSGLNSWALVGSH